MIALGRGQLTVWADTIGIPNLALAEHDLRLTYALAGLYAAPALKNVLAFKGGTGWQAARNRRRSSPRQAMSSICSRP